MLLQGKTALITGGTRGIGAAIAALFQKNGATVIITGTTKETVDIQVATLGANSHGFVCDFANPIHIKALVKQLQESKLEPDILVNNAGVMEDAPLMMSRDEMIQRQISINLIAPITLTREILKMMARKRNGSIIHIASIIGVNGNAGQSVYAASKAGIIGFTKSLSKELAPLQIRVNAIAPGYIATDLVAGYSNDLQQKTLGKIGMRKTGTPEQVAESALFLASDNSGYITGQILGVDGGMIV
ncbi:MAG: SDR family oxidoreductase [Bacteroidetes bacterium]|nr:SDR family oxidoreductase [Bacteroidota bacterium]